ncbi:MAG: GIY-YIG nuclease family protein [Patescibacteria group bacterium]|jgi:excinuclease ABC subunit C|nr:GIY-YIG nuclease family protein [Patescibacteria group bacterium]
MNLEKIKKLNIPKAPGSYQFFDKDGVIIYIGKAANLNSRVLSYWQKSTNHSPSKHAMMKIIKKIEWVETDSEIEALLLESNLIKKHQPQFNILLRDDKRFLYVYISTDDEIPGVFTSRKIGRSGKYFGPFVSAQAVKETLKAIRKIWPYCSEKKLQKTPCFYYQVNKCLGICGGLVTREEYMKKIIKPIILFFEGKKEKILKDLEKQKKSFEKEGNEEELRRIKFYIKNMKNVLDHANILGLVDKYATDVIELAKILSLPKIPNRIEGFDISNIYGESAVGSMVVFEEGESNKKEYKKFKIKVSEKDGDTGMMREVLERRFAHSISKEEKNLWPNPDLIILDGGKGQLNVALKILKKYKLDIPVIAISKGVGLRSAAAPDKIFFPGEKTPLELSLSSPAMHLIKRVRDESHRFAIKYHRELRRKSLFKK